MTRYRLLRLARVSAGVIGVLLLGAGIRRLGIPSALAVTTFCLLAGASASLGWHGVRYRVDRHEEQLRAERRHRMPRPDRDDRRQAHAELAPEPGPEVDAATPAAADPYAEEYAQPAEPFGFDADNWFGSAEDDLYAHPAGTA